VQTRRAEALTGFRYRAASARNKKTPGEAPGVEVVGLPVKERPFLTPQNPPNLLRAISLDHFGELGWPS
jgi:hypothetical protein